MIKVLAFVRKRADLSIEEFERYWSEEHAPLAKKLGQNPYRINIVRKPLDADSPVPFDGTAEMYWPTEQEFRAALESPEGVIAGEDVSNFAESVTLVIVDEHLMTP